MLTLIHGPFHPHLERAFADELRLRKREDPLASVLVIAPSRRLLERLRRLALEAFPGGLANVRFVTLAGLAHEVFAEGRTDLPVFVDEPLLYRTVIGRVVKEKLAQSPRLGPLLHYPGLLDLLHGTVRDLQDALVDPVEGVRAVQEGMYEGAEGELLAELFLLQLCYREVLERHNLVDRSGLDAGAAARLEGSRWLHRFRAVLCYGLYDATGAQEELLEALGRACDLAFFVPFDRNDSAYEFAKPFYYRLLGRTRWIKDPRPPRPDPPRVSLVHASGRADEAWRIAKEVARYIEDERVPPHHIAVVARTLEDGHGAALAAAFTENAIPYATGWRPRLLDHPLAKAVAQLIGLEEEGHGRRAVLELVSSPFFLALADEQEPRPDLWDLATRRLAIRGGRESWLDRLARVAGQDVRLSREDPEEGGGEPGPRIAAEHVDRLRARVESLFRALAPVPDSGSWAGHADAWRAALTGIFWSGDDPADARAWEGILAALDRLRGCDRAGGEVDRRLFVTTLLHVLEGARLGPESDPAAESGVRILDAMDARGLSFPILFLVGLNEPGFPRAIHEEPFLRDGLRRRLAEVPGGALGEKLRGFEEERMLFRMLERSATRALHLSWQRSDEDGRALLPSAYVRPWLEQADAGKLTREAVPLGTRQRLGAIAWNRLTPREAALLLALREAPAAPCLRAAGRDVADYEHSLDALAKIDRFGRMTGFDGIVGDLGELWTQMARRGLSPTALEDYAKCPFRFFAKHVLELEPLEEPERVAQLSPADQGILIHAILERTVRAIHAAGGYERPGAVDAVAVLRAHAGEVFAEFEKDSPVGWPLLWEARKRVLLRRLEEFLALDLARIAKDGFLPRYVEKHGREDLVLGRETVRVHGYMDRLEVRLDAREIAFRVRDYKTGRLPSDLRTQRLETAIRKGKRLQLPIYLAIGAAFLADEYVGKLPKRTIRAEEAIYEYLGPNLERPEEIKLSGRFWDSDDGTKTRELLGLLTGSIRKGNFFIHPSSEAAGHCSYCDFGTMCRKEHIPTARRAEEDPDAEAYRDAVGK